MSPCVVLASPLRDLQETFCARYALDHALPPPHSSDTHQRACLHALHARLARLAVQRARLQTQLVSFAKRGRATWKRAIRAWIAQLEGGRAQRLMRVSVSPAPPAITVQRRAKLQMRRAYLVWPGDTLLRRMLPT